MPSSDRRPNVLFLMSDEHRADLAGFAGNPVVRTPVLDRLARSGVVFSNAFTPAPACVPARQCLMAGQLPKTCKCEGWFDLEPGYQTFARLFSRYAYYTVCAGKLHHQGPDQTQGWMYRLAGDIEVLEAYIDGRVAEEFKRYSPLPGTEKWSNQKEIERAGIGISLHQKADLAAKNAALDYIERYFCDSGYDHPRSHRPLLLKASFKLPHYPFLTDADKFSYYLNRVPVHVEPRCDHPVLSRTNYGPDVKAAERDIRRATAAYYGMVETLDSYLGEILDALDHVGQDLDDWIVVYTSDHGEMLGQHGIWEKIRFYDASVRVPLIIRWPRRFQGGRSVDRNVSLCDLFATLCDCCGIPVPDGLDSRSLVPLLEGRAAGWHDEAVSEYGAGHVNLPGRKGSHHVMIKTGSLKYQYYGSDGPEVLFDLARDPGENVNFAADPGYAAEMSRFRNRLAELGHGPDADPGYVNAGYCRRKSGQD